MKKVFKFYKPNCPPCYTLSRILRHIQIPEDIEIVEINTLLEEHKQLVDEYEIENVPVLSFETGQKLIGLNSASAIENFLNSKIEQNGK